MNVEGWKVWYTHNRIYRSNMDDWESLPKTGLLAVALYYDEFYEDGKRYKDVLAGSRRYFQAIGTSGRWFIKPSLWKENKLIETYKTKPEWIKEGVWDDDDTMQRVNREAVESISWD